MLLPSPSTNFTYKLTSVNEKGNHEKKKKTTQNENTKFDLVSANFVSQVKLSSINAYSKVLVIISELDTIWKENG